MKEEWKRPELIVIVKTELEEDVLAGCKSEGPVCDPEGGAIREVRPS